MATKHQCEICESLYDAAEDAAICQHRCKEAEKSVIVKRLREENSALKIRLVKFARPMPESPEYGHRGPMIDRGN
jgi:hypothetical protein